MKLKHNKKRNTAFLFETLVREITKCALEQDKKLQTEIIDIIKEFFNKKSILNQELKLYKSVLETRGMNKNGAERILNRVQQQYNFLDKIKIFETQSRLIKKVNKVVGKNTYSNFVPNYKYIATIYQVLNGDLKPKEHIMMENTLVDYMCSTKQEQEEQKSDKLVFKHFLDKFNETYGKALNENQKEMLRLYINSINDNGLEFKMYLKEEARRLEHIISEASKNDQVRKEKLENILTIVETLKKKKFHDKTLVKILQIQELADGLTSDEN